jgi:RNA polymerase sigma-70 factor (ECF subfamily)
MARAASTEQVASSGTEARGDPAGAQSTSDFGQVYDLHVDFVWRTLRRFGVPDASLDDAVQDVFIVAYSKLGEFEGRSSLRTWIFGIARRVARDHRPAGRVLAISSERLEALPEIAWSAQEVTAEQVDAARLLERLLVQLHPEKREAFILVEVEQMTIVEAAEALGVNPNTAYSRLRAARSELEQALGRLEAHSAWRQGCQS